MNRLTKLLALPLAATLALACSPGGDTVTDAGSTDAGKVDEFPDDGPPALAGKDCDPLVPSHCGFPFPSDAWLVEGFD